MPGGGPIGWLMPGCCCCRGAKPCGGSMPRVLLLLLWGHAGGRAARVAARRGAILRRRLPSRRAARHAVLLRRLRHAGRRPCRGPVGHGRLRRCCRSGRGVGSRLGAYLGCWARRSSWLHSSSVQTKPSTPAGLGAAAAAAPAAAGNSGPPCGGGPPAPGNSGGPPGTPGGSMPGLQRGRGQRRSSAGTS